MEKKIFHLVHRFNMIGKLFQTVTVWLSKLKSKKVQKNRTSQSMLIYKSMV